MKLKFQCLEAEFKKHQPDLNFSYKDALKDMMCKDSSKSCHLLTCQKSITEVKYNEWVSTDR